MGRNKENEEGLEIPFCEEDFDEILKEMEADSEYNSYTVPKDWDQEFRAAIKAELREQRKREHRLRIKRIVKVAEAVAVIVLILFIDNLSVKEVHGKGILKFFQAVFDFGNDKYIMYGTDENMSMDFQDEETGDIFFDGSTLDEVFSQIRDELKAPIFYCEDVFDEYEIREAKYNEEFNMVNIEIKTIQGEIYITQEILINNNGASIMSNREECSIVFNENIEQDITIYENKSEDGYWFSIQEQNVYFSIIGNTSLEECEKVAKNLYYK